MDYINTMKLNINRNTQTINDLSNWMAEGSLVINPNYQREKGLWPINARTYFIDTILNDFPFPKIIIRDMIDIKTRKSKREIIDGQQRMTTINDFINDNLTLSAVSKNYSGKKFSELEEDTRRAFLAYQVSVDNIIDAPTTETVLEIFRRVNSYTVPLNETEKRHARFQGEFKWFVLELAKTYTPLFESYEILTTRQMARMDDADLLTELCLLLDEGIATKSNQKKAKLYQKYDINFPKRTDFEKKIKAVFDYIKTDLNEVLAAKVLKGYSLYSLFAALIYNKWGLVNSNLFNRSLPKIDVFCSDNKMATQNILELYNSVDNDETEGKFKEFVRANKRATSNKDARLIRTKWIVAATQNKLHLLTR